jgi:hypothetical protein
VHITHSYLGTTVGRFRYLFFALYEDYNDFGRAFVKEFNVSLERLARDLKDQGAVISPFLADIEAARASVLEKDWTTAEREEVAKVPSLLVVDKDFDDFSPREDPWVLFHFGARRFDGDAGVAEMDEVMRAIVEIATAPDTDTSNLFDLAYGMTAVRPEIAQVFELKPGIFGFSVNILAAGSQLQGWVRGRRRPVGGHT